MKQIILSLFLSVSILGARGQSIYFYFADGTNAAYPLNQVRSITFSGDVMNLNETDGYTVSWNVSTISNYRYDPVTTGIEEYHITKNINIYPNPGTGAVNIAYELAESENVTIEIFDLQGKLVKELLQGVLQTGNNRISWDISDNLGKPATSGTYFCRVSAGNQTVSKSIIIQK